MAELALCAGNCSGPEPSLSFHRGTSMDQQMSVLVHSTSKRWGWLITLQVNWPWIPHTMQALGSCLLCIQGMCWISEFPLGEPTPHPGGTHQSFTASVASPCVQGTLQDLELRGVFCACSVSLPGRPFGTVHAPASNLHSEGQDTG